MGLKATKRVRAASNAAMEKILGPEAYAAHNRTAVREPRLKPSRGCHCLPALKPVDHSSHCRSDSSFGRLFTRSALRPFPNHLPVEITMTISVDDNGRGDVPRSGHQP